MNRLGIRAAAGNVKTRRTAAASTNLGTARRENANGAMLACIVINDDGAGRMDSGWEEDAALKAAALRANPKREKQAVHRFG